MASDIKLITDSFASVRVSTTQVGMASAVPSVWLGGVFVGTVQLQAQPPGQTGFQPLTPIGAASANMTAAGVYAFPPIGGDYTYQLSATAYTSGAINAELQLSPSP
jgi:hypothetical protein